MSSYTSSQMTTPVRRIILNGSATVGDKLIITLNGADVTYVVKQADLLNGYVFTQFAAAIAAAINASTAIDPVSKQPINRAFVAVSGLGNNVGVRYLLWCAVSPQPGYDHAFTIATRYVPINAGALSPFQALLSVSPNYFVTVTGTIPAGSVLTTMVNAVSETYTVQSGDTAPSIAAQVAMQVLAARPHQISTVVDGSQVLVFNGTSAGALTLSASLTLPVVTEKPALYVSGRFLHDRHGNQVVLRGVDYQLSDDPQFPTQGNALSEILQTGANSIRIQWYMNYYPDPDKAKLLTPEALGGFLDQCTAANIVPIVELADIMCPTDTTPLNAQLIPWWTSAEVAGVLKARQSYLILNLANEMGEYQWADDPATALAQYLSDYKTAISSMRAAGYVLPLMIDAPDCGISIQVFTQIGAQLVAADPLGNLLLSTHAYWAGYDGTSEVANAVKTNLPILFAEIANKQDESVDGQEVYGYYGLDKTNSLNANFTGFSYQDFLQNTLLPNEIGWLAWSWYPDSCGPRNMSSNGTFAALTPYGQDIVHNPVYGLKLTAKPIVP